MLELLIGLWLGNAWGKQTQRKRRATFVPSGRPCDDLRAIACSTLLSRREQVRLVKMVLAIEEVTCNFIPTRYVSAFESGGIGALKKELLQADL